MWHDKTKEEVLKELETNESGLTSKEASERLKKYGPNEIKQVVKITPLGIFLNQFRSVFVMILLFAAAFSLFVRHYLDFGVIVAIIVLNSFIGFFQQYNAEKTINELRKMLVPRVRVMREGRLEEVSSLSLVPGDIIILSEGDKVTADCRLLDVNELQVNEAVLTGESFPQGKSSDKFPFDTVLANRANMVYTGTSVVRGSARAIVVDTNMRTEFGKIAKLVQQIKPEKTPFEKKLDYFSEKIAIVVILLAVIVAGIGIYRGESLFDMILASISLAVSVVPEGLPAILAITLAFAIKRMERKKALIRKLPAAETLGRTTVICTDKTGTLTEEKMSVSSVYAGAKFFDIREGKFYNKGGKIIPESFSSLIEVLKTGIMCNNARLEFSGKKIEIFGDPTEKALVMSAYGANLVKGAVLKKEKREKEYSFSSSRKMMSIVRRNSNGLISYVKGAPDIILERCTREFIDGQVVNLNGKRRGELKAVHESMASEALRVLGFAYKPLGERFDQDDAENGLIFVGFQGMLDMPRKEVKGAIKHCLDAGIKVKMITGDSLLTAQAVSKMIGLNGESIECNALEKMSDDDFDKCVRGYMIFARITPEIKLKIVKSLKKEGEVVAVTGDGVNDILALKEAHIGVAMGIRGTDVAREVSDIILLDDNFNTIVSAVREGRKVYDNMKKSIKAHLAANGAELLLVMVALLIAWPLPMLPLAILWMNLITDSLPSLSLAVEKEEHDVMKRKPRNKETILDGMKLFLALSVVFTFIAAIVMFWLYKDVDLAKARTLTLTTAVFCEMFIVISCRSRDKTLLDIGFFSNKFLVVAIASAIVLQFIAIYTPLALVFGFVPLSLKELIAVAAISVPPLIFFETMKFLKFEI